MTQQSVPEEVQAVAESTVRPFFRRVLPVLVVMFVIAFIDRSNLGFARESLNINVGISDAAFALGAGLFFLGYAVFEIPSNIILHKVGARVWMCRIMVTWGLVTFLTMFVNSEATFYLARIMLGVAEAGFFPGAILYLTYWVPAKHASRARGILYLGVPLANIINGPISGGLVELDGTWGLHAHQWLFMTLGALTTILGFFVLKLLPNRPDEVDWLTAEQKSALARVLAAEDASKGSAARAGALKVLAGPRVWSLALVFFAVQAAVYGLTFFLPTQVAALVGGQVGFVVGVVTSIPWIAALIGVLYFSRLADRTGRHRLIASLLLLGSGLGIGISGAVGSPIVGLLALCLAAMGFIAVQPVFWALPTTYLGGFAAASGIGLINSLGNLGGFVAPNLRTAVVGATGSEMLGLIALAAVPVIGSALIALTAFAKGKQGAEQSLEQTVAVEKSS